MALRIRVNDTVQLRSGDDRGKRGRVLEVLEKREHVVGEGLVQDVLVRRRVHLP